VHFCVELASNSFATVPRSIQGIQVSQACTPRPSKVELANMSRILQESFKNLEAKPFISINIPNESWKYLPIQPLGALGYMPGRPDLLLIESHIVQ
jgi:hypothetical protein